MTITPERQRILDKLLKLKAQAESSTFPEERDTCYKLIADLMLKHDIELSESTEEVEFNGVGEDCGEATDYNRILVRAIGDLCDCFVYTAWIDNVKIVRCAGRKSDVEEFNYITHIVKGYREKGFFTYLKTHKPTKIALQEYYLGFSVGLRAQIRLILDARQAARTADSKALMIIDRKKAAENHVEELIGKLETKKGKPLKAFASAGYNDGKSVTWNKGITAVNRGLEKTILIG